MVKVLYFAGCRDRTGIPEEELPLDGLTVAAALEYVGERHPKLPAIFPHCRVAINQEFAEPTDRVPANAEFAMIPPVAGGSSPSQKSRMLSSPLLVDAVLERVSADQYGAQVVMIGTVRNHSEGESVESLRYEAYAEMAEKVMDQIIVRVENEFPGTTGAVDHRFGDLQIGDRAVVVAASSAHREVAFKACKEIIDRLKESTPIWKYETRENGALWVGLGP
jgi:MoaE-MoaD fusion protein